MKDSMMTNAECTKLIEALLQDAEYHPYAVYGLIFLFSSIKQNSTLLEDICFEALKTLYAESENIEIGIERITSDIHNIYRKTDFTKEYAEIVKPFLEAEKREIISASETVTTAEMISFLITDESVPSKISDALGDAIADLDNGKADNSPEYIASILESVKNE